jgi:hypothetical protein
LPKSQLFDRLPDAGDDFGEGFVAIRVDEIRTDQQQNDVGGFQVVINRARPILARDGPAVMPDRDHLLLPQAAEVSVEFLSPLVVAVGI